MKEDTLNLIIFVSRSKIRKLILEELKVFPNIATLLEKKINKHLSVISRALLELCEKELIICLNPKDDRFRKYEITALGLEILSLVD
jgi:hypothetical protein